MTFRVQGPDLNPPYPIAQAPVAKLQLAGQDLDLTQDDDDEEDTAPRTGVPSVGYAPALNRLLLPGTASVEVPPDTAPSAPSAPPASAPPASRGVVPPVAGLAGLSTAAGSSSSAPGPPLTSRVSSTPRGSNLTYNKITGRYQYTNSGEPYQTPRDGLASARSEVSHPLGVREPG